jgi:hypothetical protein
MMRAVVLHFFILFLLTGLPVPSGISGFLGDQHSGTEPPAAVLVSLGAQENDEQNGTPYARRLRAAVGDPQVRLSWRDTQALTGEAYEIYRSTTQITAETFEQAQQVGTVAEGTETFLDVPSEDGTYYYAVLVRSEEGRLHRTFYEYRNTTVEPIELANTAEAEPPLARISGLRAQIVERRVELRFTASRTERELAVYRSTDPIDSSEALANATRVERVPGSREQVADFPVPGVPYYYAVLDAEAPARGETSAEPGRNATAEPVEIPLAESAQAAERQEPALPESSVRRRPLPLLQLQQDLTTGQVLPQSQVRVPDQPQELSSETEAAVQRLFGNVRSAEQERRSPTVLPPERDEEGKGAARTLTGIVQDTILREAWAEGAEMLDRLLTLDLPADVAARAHYYRGQSYYFQGDLREGLFEFLLAREQYRQEVQPWVTRILEELDGDQPDGSESAESHPTGNRSPES